jgi:hypothetical protein
LQAGQSIGSPEYFGMDPLPYGWPMSLELYRSVLADKQSQIRNLEERKLVKAGGITPTNDIAARAAQLEREVSELKAIVAYLERVTVPSGKAP